VVQRFFPWWYNAITPARKNVMSRIVRPRLAILGAGPLGIEAALAAAHLQVPFVVYERGQVGQSLRAWGHARLFTPFGINSTTLGKNSLRHDQPRIALPADADHVSGRDFLKVYLEPVAQLPQMRDHIQAQTEVVSVGRRGCLAADSLDDARRRQQPFILLLRDQKGVERIEEADVILDCTGVYGRHRWLGDGGIPARGERKAAAHIAYGLEDILGERRGHYAGRTTLVVGGGLSAASTVCDLATLGEKETATWVIWAARGPSSLPIRRISGDPLKERDRVAMRANQLAARPDGNVEFHGQTWIVAVEGDNNGGFRVEARKNGETVQWQVERVIANVGYRLDNELARELRPNEPDYHVLGVRGSDRPTGFLLQQGFEQIRELFRRITGKTIP